MLSGPGRHWAHNVHASRAITANLSIVAGLWAVSACVLASNSPMAHPHDIEQRLTDLEIKASFAEDLVDQLNAVIVRQQQQLDALLREVMQLRQQMPEGGSGTFRSLRDDLPPHY
jgi:SlyX protein